MFCFTGCSPDITPETDEPRTFEGVTLNLQCADRPLADALQGITRAWSARTGATVTINSTEQDSADVLVLPAAEVGAFAERGELQLVPTAIRATGNAYHWNGVLSVYRGEQFAGWGGQIVALPLAGDGHVLVYRTDRYRDPAAAILYEIETDRELAPPSTWEEFAVQADFFQRFDGRPSLPPLSSDPDHITNDFFRVAACYERVAVGEAETNPAAVDSLSFAFETETGKPRLTSPGFRQAAEWFAKLKPATSTEAPATFMANGQAVLGVFSLAELATFQKGSAWNPSRFGIAPLPGTDSYYDVAGKALPADGNYIPYFSSGRLGVVHKRCMHPDAAFELLAEIGGPERSLELLSTPGLGFGPFREAHLDRDRLVIWLGYGFNEERSKELQESLRVNLGRAVRNPAFGLRGPDQAKLNAALGREVAAIVRGTTTPEDGLTRALNEWNTIDATVPADELRLWRRRAVGLN